jgi:hypothetical protein
VEIMETTITAQLSNRDRAVLRAIAQGRCQVSGACGTSLVIDGLSYADQFAGSRLAGAGLIAVPGRTTEPARLTPTGMELLQAA